MTRFDFSIIWIKSKERNMNEKPSYNSVILFIQGEKRK